MKYRILHETRYGYTESVSLCHSVAHLTPRNLPWQKLHRSQITIDPMPSAYGEHEDIFGNTVSFFALQQPHDHLTITAASVVELTGTSGIDDRRDGKAWEEVRDTLLRECSPDCLEARQFVLPSPHVHVSSELAAYAAPSFQPERPIVDALGDLMNRIHRDFAFVAGYTTVSTPLDEVLRHRKGVCQDFSHLAIGCLRSLGLAARYASGYIETIAPAGKEKLRGADVSHAWYSAFVPGMGWLDFDPTNNIVPATRHVTVALGRDYSDVVPVKGVIFSSGSQELMVSVDMERLDSDPSVPHGEGEVE
jgi:transglutaminase-like putative cysteine protease